MSSTGFKEFKEMEAKLHAGDDYHFEDRNLLADRQKHFKTATVDHAT